MQLEKIINEILNVACITPHKCNERDIKKIKKLRIKCTYTAIPIKPTCVCVRQLANVMHSH